MKKVLPRKILDKCTERAQRVISDAMLRGKGEIQPIDFLYAITNHKGSLGANILRAHSVKTETVKRSWLKNRNSQNKKGQRSLKSFSEPAKDILKKSVALASEHQNTYIGTEHLVGAIIELGMLKSLIEKRGKPALVTSMRRQINTILTTNAQFPNLSVLGESVGGDLISRKDKTNGEKSEKGSFRGKKGSRKDSPMFSMPATSSSLKTDQESFSALDYFSEDLVEKAYNGELDPLIGRDNEVDRLINILSRRSKNNPILIGEAGVGKTAIVYGLAQRMADQKVPEHLLGKRLLSLDLGMLIAGTVFRGEFEGRLKDVIREAQDEQAIIFIDEIHTIIGAGAAQGSLDAANMIKPAISQGVAQIIGATTTDEYRKHIEKDPALERRFQPIVVRETSREETAQILKGLKKHLENYHSVEIDNKIIEKTVLLSERFIQNRFFPDKAIDVLDEAAAQLRSQKTVSPQKQKFLALKDELRNIQNKKELAIKSGGYEEALKLRVDEEKVKKEIDGTKLAKDERLETSPAPILAESDIERVISRMAGVDLEKISEPEKNKLLNLERLIRKNIIGQEEAIKNVSAALRRSRSGIKDEQRPIGSFLFMGPSGVGKTEFAKVLAQIFFEAPNSLIKVDMSEFSESHTVSKFIGAPAGYVGYDDTGNILELVRRQPYSLVLFDEIEKAHSKIHNLLLQILEDGELTSAHGTKVSFRNALIIITSNIGSSHFGPRGSLGFDKITKKTSREEVIKEIPRYLKPELVSRLDNVVVFGSLDKKDIEKIVELELKKLKSRLKGQGINFSYEKSAAKILAERSQSRQHGARKVRVSVRDLVENPLAQKIISGELENKKRVVLATSNKKLSWKTQKK